MHTDLSSHLHTDKCNELIKLIRACRIEHPFRKFMGTCDKEYVQMTKCLKQERISRRQKSIELSKERKVILNRKLKEQTDIA